MGVDQMLFFEEWPFLAKKNNMLYSYIIWISEWVLS